MKFQFKMPQFKMPQFKMPNWVVNAGWGLAFVGIIIGGIVMVAAMFAVALARVAINLFAGPFMRAGVLWLAWTYSGFGLLFTSLPPHLQQIDFLPIFCGAVIWQVLVFCIRAPFRKLNNPFGTATERAKRKHNALLRRKALA